MSKKHIVLCGVPDRFCSGSKYPRSNNLQASAKGHTSHDDAYRCMVRYLTHDLGFTPISSAHCYAPPDGGPVRMLGKKSRFGAVLRLGKENTRFMYQNGSGTVLP